MRSCLRDLKFGLKLLVREKGFTLTALLTVALCVGANSAIFTVLQSVLLRPLPYPEPERLVLMYNCYPGVSVQKGANSTPDYFDRRELKDVFEEVALIGFSGYDVGAEGSPERISGLYVTPSMFRMLRIAPQLGRVCLAHGPAGGRQACSHAGSGGSSAVGSVLRSHSPGKASARSNPLTTR